MIGIITSTKLERDAIIKSLGKVHEESCGITGQKYYLGSSNETKIIVICYGMGRVNAAAATMYLFNRYEINYIISVGTSLIANKKIENGTICLVNQAKYYDLDLTIFGVAKGQVPLFPEYFKSDSQLNQKVYNVLNRDGIEITQDVNILTRDKFLLNDKFEKHNNETNKEHWDLFDLTVTAIAQVCFLAKKKWIAITIAKKNFDIKDIKENKENLTDEKPCKTYEEIFHTLFQNISEVV